MRTQMIGKFVFSRLIPLTSILVAMMITGCGVGGSSKEGPPATPNISLLSAQIDFGVVVLDKSADKNIQIRNTGNANLTIGQITQNNFAGNPFSMISDGCSGGVISPSSSCTMIVRFAPTAQAEYHASLDIPSNDSDAGLLTATLSGKGRALNMSINRVILDPQTQTVQLIVSLRDQFDNPVTTLTESDFSILENGSPKNILGVSNTMTPPVSVSMGLDYSSTTIPFTQDLEDAAKSFVDLLDPASDEAQVIKFATLIEVMQMFTQDQVALKDAIDAPFPYERLGTSLYDVLWDSINYTSERLNPRLAIVSVSDGKDTRSTRTISEVIAGAVDSNVQIFTIGIGNADNVILQQLATETGGQYFFAPDPSDLATIYATISEILSNEYTIVYSTSSVAGSTISLEVLVDDNGQLGEISRTIDF